MAATEMTRNQLKLQFQDGDRPSGEDFESAWLSCVNKIDDNIKRDANGNLELGFTGIKINDTPSGNAGTLRFNAGQLQFHDGVSFKSLSSGSSSPFVIIAGSDIGYSLGNVGINTAAVAPTHRLEVNIAANTGASQRVKLGNLIVHNGTAGTAAVLCNAAVVNTAAAFALSQDSLGQTTLNSATDLFLNQNNVNRLMIFSSGNVQIAPVTSLTITGHTIIGSNVLPALNRNLTVNGEAFKLVAGGFQAIASDERIKKDIRPYMHGLKQVLAFKPVSFKFNGKAGTPDDGKDYIGFIAQDVQKVAPDLIFSRRLRMDENDQEETELLNYDVGPVTFILVNAIQELNERLEKIEKKKPK
jgi:Chaperone of endosialidase